MTDTQFLRIVGTAEALELTVATDEESLAYQAKLLGLWEQQQRVLGYTEASIALNSRNLDIFLNVEPACAWRVLHDFQLSVAFCLAPVGQRLPSVGPIGSDLFEAWNQRCQSCQKTASTKGIMHVSRGHVDR